MRYLRRYGQLSLFLRVANILGLLLSLAVLAQATTMVFHLQPFPLLSGVNASRMELVTLDIGLLDLAIIATLSAYQSRHMIMRLPPASWQTQARTLVLMAVLPLCGLILALYIPPTRSIYGIAFAVSLLAIFVVMISALVIFAGRQPAGE